MKNELKLSLYLTSLVFIIVGAILGLESFGAFDIGFTKIWVSTLLCEASVAFLVGEFVSKSKLVIYTPIWTFFAGLILGLINLGIFEFTSIWPIIPFAIFLSMALSALVRRESVILSEIGLWGVGLSIILLCATLFDIFQYVLPVGLILVGVSVVIRISIKKKEGYKIPSISIEERKKEILNSNEEV
ncbi:MAG: hypothetical protein IJF76_02275 [Clostridia bacterium]|nr:hypothetical protein [Clostridia bacterium]